MSELNINQYKKIATAVRILCVDAVENAASGHPGMPLGMADIAVVLWKKYLKHSPQNPLWANRDRFILSNGHGSMLLYSLLHLCGYDLDMHEIKNFRKLNSKTPGHPEYGHTPGVETTTGPLGQGLANAVGMALARKLLSHRFNRPEFNLLDHFVYAFVGDGCLMEGISHEVCSLAGTMNLDKLIIMYDANNITIDGNINNWYTEDVALRFRAYGFYVIDNVNGHDFLAIDSALSLARKNSNKPVLIIFKTVIGYGSDCANTAKCHGSPLGFESIKALRKHLDWNYDPFVIPQDIYSDMSCIDYESEWNKLFKKYQNQYPELAQEFIRCMNHDLIDNFETSIDQGITWILDNIQNNVNVSTRVASQNAINHYAQYIPELLGGSADLTGSNLTSWKNAVWLSCENDFTGNYVSYGVREFGMSAIANGIYLYGGHRVFVGTFLMFSEYARNALRMASLMKIAPIFVFTHDSIALGEDGPTHQGVEQLATLRLIPNMHVWRPCDSFEMFVAWGYALKQKHTPSCIIASRQAIGYVPRDVQKSTIERGGYVVHEQDNHNNSITIIATGSEVYLASLVCSELKDSYSVRLVSMPCTNLFDEQEDSYKQYVLGNGIRFVIEAGVSDIWYKYVGCQGLVFGVDDFGVSACQEDLFDYFGLNVQNIVSKIKTHLCK